MDGRQKQYFEQRKRQQQLEEHSPSVSAPYTRSHENNRSLDVLSLLNLSKNGQDCTSRFPEGRGNSHDEKKTPNYQSSHCPNTIRMETKNLCPSKHVEKRETRIASSPFEERVCPQKSDFLMPLRLPSDFSSHGPPDASRRNNAIDPMKMTTDYSELSVIDMLGDDGQTNSSKGNFVHENHVSFSVEGLGKVEMTTPVHSPHPTRNMSYGCSALPKHSKRSHTSRNLKFSLEDQFPEMDDAAFGVDVQTDASSLKLPTYFVEPRQNLKQKTMVGEECFLHAAKNFSSNDDIYDLRVEQDRFKWHENSRLLDENFLDDTRGLSRKSWPYDLDSSMENQMRSRKYDKPDFSFDSFQTPRNRASSKAACSFNMSELSSPYKHQREHCYDFMTADMTCYPTTRRNSDFSDMTHSSAWSSFATEDARDYPSFLSKDACTSPAVWREESKNPLFNTTERQKIRVHEADYRSPVNKFSMKRNLFRMSDFSSEGDDWLYEEQCNLENKKSGYASMNASKTRKSTPFSYKHWTEEPLNSDFNLKYSADDKSSEHDAFSGNLFSDKVAFCQKVSPGHSSPIIRNINEECGHPESYNDPLKEEQLSPKMQYQESVSTGTQSATLPSVSSTFEQSNYSSSANGSQMNVVDSEDNQSQFEESKIKTPEMTPRPHAALSPLRSEGGSSSVAMPQEPEGDGSKEHSNGTQTSLSSLNEHKEDSGHGKDLKCEGPHRSLGQSCQVMMLGRFVLQLM
ncbi:hypothetical protein CTI12_AA158840 [Artemisia annua]|uniref:Uncharacterized protein n=1 Tax=Artemisia annua TaxID=35608 RepID=A0A2U1PF78_ARTAN|nr:hypothetical protein CTI12_AA158840 [Artemisia annua]